MSAAAPLRVMHVSHGMDLGGAERVVLEHVRHAGPGVESYVCATHRGGRSLEEAARGTQRTIGGNIKVRIPAGVSTGSSLRVRGRGEAGPAGAGDLYVIIEVLPHPVFSREDNNLVVEKSISLSQAVLGGLVEVQTLDGPVKMKIPAGTQPGKTFRLKGRGVRELRGRGVGDELVRINVTIPESRTPELRKLMEEVARLSGEK
mgnify:CR=1 FL=1